MSLWDAVKMERVSDQHTRFLLRGPWKIGEALPSAPEVIQAVGSEPPPQRISIDASALAGWDTSLPTFLAGLQTLCRREGIALDLIGLPEGVIRLQALAAAAGERQGALRAVESPNPIARLGGAAVSLAEDTVAAVGFIGEAAVALSKFLTGRAYFQRSDLLVYIQEAGAGALPIVTLISLLVGLIFAFVGAVQLVLFGAQIYVANMVAIAIVRVMGAVMLAVIMAGRTGAAYAAQLGTMQVNEEIDALRTLGISPMEFLVLPRMLALIVMMPLLCVYADLMGILGGLIVGVGMLDIGIVPYINQTRAAVNLGHFFIGLAHALVFGVLIATAGCLRGMQCGRSAAAVGAATTSAVVTAIVGIVIATAVITVICNVLGV